MLTLGIETSCDETSVALLRDEADILVNLIASQVDAHQLFGGVVPEIASRKHLEVLNPLLAQLQKETAIQWQDIDLVAVTHGPGLVGALLVGVAAAKGLSYAYRIPCQPVNHIEGHIASNFLARPDLKFPMLCLVVSGGHSDLILMRDHGVYERLGKTRDDAVGEAFDKVARALGLPLPGGPWLEKTAREGDPRAFEFTPANLEPSLDFSYSGLKTAAAQAMQKSVKVQNEQGGESRVADIAASFQRSAIRQLRRNVERALERYPVATFGLCGGVAANGALREELKQAAEAAGVDFVVPDKVLCTDNAAMIAAAGYYRFLARPEAQQHFSLETLEFDTHSLLPVA
ncbi:MAG: tRNA (adenosine(37)-N6)-threonylcarbamoyltransferase complex transferase subunit TsaD [Abitibacteriaceae bacterium]|nr:tRNA (adenosine(37)-N6)-threonylcarbamoyltransferase complex transferase subunit TsaD [Abditibacteriaceae bacterium]